MALIVVCLIMRFISFLVLSLQKSHVYRGKWYTWDKMLLYSHVDKNMKEDRIENEIRRSTVGYRSSEKGLESLMFPLLKY